MSKAVGKLRVEALVGGAEWKRKTTRNVSGQNVDMLVTTPGLLLKMRDESKQLFTSDVKRVIFDEAGNHEQQKKKSKSCLCVVEEGES
jgi:superfamily II DNA/RNA helicase